MNASKTEFPEDTNNTKGECSCQRSGADKVLTSFGGERTILSADGGMLCKGDREPGKGVKASTDMREDSS